MRPPCTAMLVFGLVAGCGAGSPPVLSELVSSERSPRVGTEVFLRARAFDVDGDLDGGRARARLAALESDLRLEGEAPLLGFEDGRLEGDVIVGVRLVGSAEPGEYEVQLTAIDAAGYASEPLQTRLTYRR